MYVCRPFVLSSKQRSRLTLNFFVKPMPADFLQSYKQTPCDFVPQRTPSCVRFDRRFTHLSSLPIIVAQKFQVVKRFLKISSVKIEKLLCCTKKSVVLICPLIQNAVYLAPYQEGNSRHLPENHSVFSITALQGIGNII